jgi:hypothetical protein
MMDVRPFLPPMFAPGDHPPGDDTPVFVLRVHQGQEIDTPFGTLAVTGCSSWPGPVGAGAVVAAVDEHDNVWLLRHDQDTGWVEHHNDSTGRRAG